MQRALIALTGGTLFGLGLGIAGIGNPVVINNFLDLASEHLDFTLLILFATAVVSATLFYQITLRVRQRPLFDVSFFLPEGQDIDKKLIVGALIFGFGWSLSGYCTGPALTSLVGAYQLALPYLGGTLSGYGLYALVSRSRATS